jgi:hypothetical protein
MLELSELALPCTLSSYHCFLSALLDKTFLELEEAPCLRGCFFLPIRLDQEEIGQARQRNRAYHPLFVARHLHLPKGQPALEFFYSDFDTPTPCVPAENRPRDRLGEIGYENVDTLWPIVTPFLGQANRDITRIVPRGAAEQGPGVATTPVRFMTGAAIITPLGSLLPKVTPIFAIRKFPGAWHGKTIRRVFFGDPTQRGSGGEACIGDHDNLPPLRWGTKACNICRNRMVRCPRSLGSLSPRALGIRTRPHSLRAVLAQSQRETEHGHSDASYAPRDVSGPASLSRYYPR